MSNNTPHTVDPTKAEDYAVNVLRRSPGYLRPVDGPGAGKRSPWEEIANGIKWRKKPDALARVRRRLRREARERKAS